MVTDKKIYKGVIHKKYMGILTNIAYRVERLFRGERGIVEKVGETPLFDSNGNKQIINYWPDDFKNPPRLVTFRNPLGELVTQFTPIEIVSCKRVIDDDSTYYRRFKRYKTGDNFS